MSTSIRFLDELTILPNSLALVGLGQAGVVLRTPDATIYLDPYLTYNGGEGKRLDRLFPPPLAPQAVSNADLVLVSHEHIDHFDPHTLSAIAEASPQAHFVGPHTCDFSAAGIARERVTLPAAFGTLELAGATVTPIPAAHTSLDMSGAGYPYFGYIIESNGVTVYHAGDTVIYDADADTPGLLDTLKGWSIDVMFVPINGRDYFRTSQGLVGNTNAREAALLADALDVALVIPTHYDLMAGNAANPAHFVDFLYRLNPSRVHHLLRPGEHYYFVRPPRG
ncbi:MAG: MBL fold metallo-hydrolase [Trueperaceae bacterium]